MDEKSNEITAIPKLLEVLDLKGALVTIDAMGCQKEIAGQIVDGRGDYLLAVKENHPHLYEDIDTCFTEALETDYEGLESSVLREEVEANRGRQETRECHVIVHPEGLRDAGLWKGLTAICMVLSHRVAEGVESIEVRYYIGSFVGTARSTSTRSGVTGASRTRCTGSWMWCSVRMRVVTMRATAARTWAC